MKTDHIKIQEAKSRVNLPLFKMHPQLVHIRRDISATRISRHGNLLHAEQRSRQRGDAAPLELPAGLQAFPCRRDLDTHPPGVVRWC